MKKFKELQEQEDNFNAKEKASWWTRCFYVFDGRLEIIILERLG
jgi:hypothetical protein